MQNFIKFVHSFSVFDAAVPVVDDKLEDFQNIDQDIIAQESAYLSQQIQKVIGDEANDHEKQLYSKEVPTIDIDIAVENYAFTDEKNQEVKNFGIYKNEDNQIRIEIESPSSIHELLLDAESYQQLQ